jgi:hypothetical protein
MMTLQLVDIKPLAENLFYLRDQYVNAEPFPHIVLDNVLTSSAFLDAIAEFPGIDAEFWQGYLHVNETKYANTQPDTWGPTLNAIAKEFVSAEFLNFLSDLTGIDNLLPDWTMDGGGLHQTLRGGHLNVHTDFSTHHTHENWGRRINILLYFNEQWQDGWGGELELWDSDIKQCRTKVKPVANRMLIFTTSADSFHGHPDALRCPEDMARRSMALYYFTEEINPVRKATNYRARPDDGMKRIAIWADRHALDLYDRLKRRMGWTDEAASSVLQRVHNLRRGRR